MGERKGKEESTKTRRNGGYKQGRSGGCRHHDVCCSLELLKNIYG